MIERIERGVLRLFKVPPDPRVVSSRADGVEAFRASASYYRFRWIGWSLSQVSAAFGILVFLWFTGLFDFRVPPALLEELAKHDVAWPREIARDRILGMSILDGFFVLEVIGIAFFLVQLPITFAMLRLDYRMRWYVLTDRSLQIRAGVRNVRKQTLSLANIQNVRLEQGPLERLFGFAGVKVRTAGGGSGGDSDNDGSGHGDDKELHIGWLRGLDDAAAVRDRILAAVRRHRDAGLGDPGERPGAPVDDEHAALDAARELLREIRAWRLVISGRGPGR